MNNQRGAVSIFIVIFTALLVTVVTTSFVQLMLRNQQQASNADLSQSAYDSAMAGVEDAKRALIRLKECQTSGTPDCVKLISELSPEPADQKCNVLGTAGIATFNNDAEVIVGAENMNQAYTCVKVDVTTDSFKGTLTPPGAAGQVMIPLIPAGGSTNDIQGVRISWFTKDDMPCAPVDPDKPGGACVQSTTANLSAVAGELPQAKDWPQSQPPIMRMQLIQFDKNNLTLSQFNANRENETNSAKTLFLYPASFGQTLNFDIDKRQSSDIRNSPQMAKCNSSFDPNASTYLCSADIMIPALTTGAQREAYIVLTGLYNKAHYKLEMLGVNGTTFDFDGVQPEVDSTGRASDLFRRVKARISLTQGTGQELTYPDAALSIKNNLCKDFLVTPDTYIKQLSNEDCNPGEQERAN